jgi:hypothetical protein
MGDANILLSSFLARLNITAGYPYALMFFSSIADTNTLPSLSAAVTAIWPIYSGAKLQLK